MPKINFLEFVWLWNQTQNQSTPKHQIKMIKWLEKQYFSENRNSLLMSFRSSGKSTIVGLFCAWLLLINPSLRILVLAADHSLSRKMVRNIKRIIEKHPLTLKLKPKLSDEWASEKFTVKRPLELRDPSVIAKGLNANLTGLRADIIICDDVEVPNTCDTYQKRKDLRESLSELDYILTPNGMHLFIGTPHTYYTIYRTKEQETPKDCDTFLKNYKKLKLPIIINGKSIWEEKFPLKKIEEIRRKSANNKFLSQMMLTPSNICNSRLNPDNLQIYEDEIEFLYGNNSYELKIKGEKMLSCSCFWDPSFGSAKGDGSIIACVFSNNKSFYLHDLTYIEVPSSRVDKAAGYQCIQAASFIKRNYIQSIKIETNGIGKFLPGLLKQELERQKIPCSVLETSSSKSKNVRILEALETLLAEKLLNVHKKVLSTPFCEEMREWQAELSANKDDGLDAVSNCILSEPFNFKSGYIPKTLDWRFSRQGFSAQTDFKL